MGFAGHLEQISSDISKQIASTQSDSARHALAYGRFEQMVLEADGLIANVQRVIQSCYDQSGNPRLGQKFDYYSNTAINIFSSYSTVRDRDLRPITSHDLDVFKKETKEASVETACRNFIKQCYERSFNEAELFAKIFSIDPQFSMDAQSAYAALKSHQRALVNPANVTPIATTIQSVLQSGELHTMCNLLAWITNEYLLLEYDDEETRYSLHCHELTARLLTEHLWPLTDASFEAEVTKSISKAPIATDVLKITPVVNNVVSSNAYPVTKRALELLAMYDEAMPKERSVSSCHYKIPSSPSSRKPTLLTPRTAKVQSRHLSHRQRDDPGVAARRVAPDRRRRRRAAASSRPGPVHDQEPVDRQEQPSLARDRRRPVAARRRHAALRPDLGCPEPPKLDGPVPRHPWRHLVPGPLVHLVLFVFWGTHDPGQRGSGSGGRGTGC